MWVCRRHQLFLLCNILLPLLQLRRSHAQWAHAGCRHCCLYLLGSRGRKITILPGHQHPDSHQTQGQLQEQLDPPDAVKQVCSVVLAPSPLSCPHTPAKTVASPCKPIPYQPTSHQSFCSAQVFFSAKQKSRADSYPSCFGRTLSLEPAVLAR